jgi:hypothetical protein
VRATEVRDALLGRWPADKHLHIYEAPMHPDRSGRKLDVVVVSVWKSRGYALDGVEIKVSMSDWKRELEGYVAKDRWGHERQQGGPDKADWWWNHVDRFWIAAPAKIATKIKPQLPPTWGLLAVETKGCRVLVQPTVNPDREMFTWPEIVGLLRATAGFGSTALAKAREDGRAAAMAEIERRGIPTDDEAAAARLRSAEHERDRLRAAIAAFEEASGVHISEWEYEARQVGRLVKIVRAARGVSGPEQLDQELNRKVADLAKLARDLDSFRATLATAFGQVEACPPLPLVTPETLG